jgi:AraC-like DNA-binding protein
MRALTALRMRSTWLDVDRRRPRNPQARASSRETMSSSSRARAARSASSQASAVASSCCSTTRRSSAVLSSADGPFTVSRPTPVTLVGLRVPRAAIRPLVRSSDQTALRTIPGAATAALRLLATYARAVVDDPALAAAESGQLIAGHLHDLVALALGPTRDAAQAAGAGGMRAARLERIKADIGAHFTDEALTLGALAARHGITPRYVHRLFEGEGLTYTQSVLGRRLACGHRLLRDARHAGRNISAIAYDVGFGDLSYFNRAFRRQYGATPSDVRHGASARRR